MSQLSVQTDVSVQMTTPPPHPAYVPISSFLGLKSKIEGWEAGAPEAKQKQDRGEVDAI